MYHSPTNEKLHSFFALFAIIQYFDKLPLNKILMFLLSSSKQTSQQGLWLIVLSGLSQIFEILQ